jgi:predicted 2-oxoglutarate/Fe(II)-dependent dioxygenase YbiX
MIARESQVIEPIPVIAPTLPEFIVKHRVLTTRQCERLAEGTSSRGRYYRSNGSLLTKRVDIAYVYPRQAHWLFTKIGSIAARKNVWNLALSAITEPIRIQRYGRGDYSDIHTDYDYTDRDYSKLTIVIPLVDPDEWEGGVLQIGNSLATPRLGRGDAVVFPSFTPHRVGRVLRGTRIVLSAWISGPVLR